MLLPNNIECLPKCMTWPGGDFVHARRRVLDVTLVSETAEGFPELSALVCRDPRKPVSAG